MVRPKKQSDMGSPSPSLKGLSFEGRLPTPDATAHLPSFGPFSFSVTMDAVLSKNLVSNFGFETQGPAVFSSLLSWGCALFKGRSEQEVEALTFEIFLAELSLSPESREYALYAWTAIQDVCGRLPFSDPLSKAIGKIHSINREFTLGTLLPDLED